METSTIISIIGLIISGISVLAVLYFNLRSNKKTDVKDIEERVAERTELNCKLDMINKNTNDIKYDISAVKKDVQKHGEKLVELDSSVRSAHHRLDTIESRINRNDDD